MEDNNKDRIKEILQKQKNKSGTKVIIIVSAIILIVGIAAGYIINSLVSTKKTNTAITLNQMSKNTDEEQSNPQFDSNDLQNSAEDLGSNNSEEIKTYAIQSDNSDKNNTKDNLSEGVSTPTIVNPYSDNKGNESSQSTYKNNNNVFQPKVKKVLEHKKTTVAKTKKHRVLHKKTVHHLRRYVIQVSSNLNRSQALRNVLKLRKCGHKTYSKKVVVNNKTYTRVMVGPISGYSAAKEESLNIKRQLKLGYFPIIKRYVKVP